jgi:hypothetical protein
MMTTHLLIYILDHLLLGDLDYNGEYQTNQFYRPKEFRKTAAAMHAVMFVDLHKRGNYYTLFLEDQQISTILQILLFFQIPMQCKNTV